MRLFDWNDKKNQWLKKNRGIYFEKIVEALNQGNLLADIPHPDQKKFSHQRIMYIWIYEYVYAVPYVKQMKSFTLKQFIPAERQKQNIKGLKMDKNELVKKIDRKSVV